MRDATLDLTTSGQCEVRLYGDEDGYETTLLRRRHVNDVKVAEGMIRTWLDYSDEMWDYIYGNVGLAPWVVKTS